MKTDVEERIMVQNTKFPAQNGNRLEGFHHPRSGVGILPDNRSEINVEVVYHDIAEFGQADVRPTVFITKGNLRKCFLQTLYFCKVAASTDTPTCRATSLLCY